jgi:hypothetical protein
MSYWLHIEAVLGSTGNPWRKAIRNDPFTSDTRTLAYSKDADEEMATYAMLTDVDESEVEAILAESKAGMLRQASAFELDLSELDYGTLDAIDTDDLTWDKVELVEYMHRGRVGCVCTVHKKLALHRQLSESEISAIRDLFSTTTDELVVTMTSDSE